MLDIPEIFTPEELRTFGEALDEFRPRTAYEPGRWMVSALNRTYGPDNFPGHVRLRDITLRTTEEMPGITLSDEERRQLLTSIIEAGVPEVVLTMFRRRHGVEVLAQTVRYVKSLAPDCQVVLANAVNPEDMRLAEQCGVDAVQVFSATYLGGAIPVSAGAVYHRVWQGRDWRNLRFPRDVGQHIERSMRLVASGKGVGIKVSASINLLHFASEQYVRTYCEAVAAAGAYEIILADTTGGTSPEALARLVTVARAAAPGCEIAVHAHNIFGLGIASSVAAAGAGCTVIEVSVNGYETGPAGCQASLAGTAVALESLYGVRTGIKLDRMVELSALAARLTGWDVPWNEPVVGSGVFESAGADEYEMERNFDPLIHASIVPELVGGRRSRRIGVTTGPLGMWDKLEELGVVATKADIEPILHACLEATRRQRRTLTDDEIITIATSYVAWGAGSANEDAQRP